VNVTITTLSNAADWHATMAMKAYRKRLYKDYRRHIVIADDIRAGVSHGMAVAAATWMERT
jgi:hypothetical protein